VQVEEKLASGAGEIKVDLEIPRHTTDELKRIQMGERIPLPRSNNNNDAPITNVRTHLI
jgi:hypothetical protein